MDMDEGDDSGDESDDEGDESDDEGDESNDEVTFNYVFYPK